jgi:WD40 repeat protein
MWLLTRSGQRNEALAHFETYRQLLEAELSVAPLEQTQAMYTQLVEGELPGPPMATVILRREPRQAGECPYRGLAAFREIDAPFFFGREAFTARLTETIRKRSMAAIIIGSSGSGKSSTVFAGLLPQLREHGDWLIMHCRPRGYPFQAVAGALAPILEPDLQETNQLIETQKLAEALRKGELSLYHVVVRALEKQLEARRLLLVVDQFEELYTLCPDPEERRRFLDELLVAIKAGSEQHVSPFALLLTLRADFMGQALKYRPFADALQDGSLILGPMNRDELRTAIEKPAKLQGAAFETGLVARLLDDVGEEPGNLPLLEFALSLLWERLDQGWATHSSYEAIGRVDGALARYAEEVFNELDVDKQEQARQVFIQLIQPGQGTEDTRRVAARTEFGDDRWKLIQHLADQRLVVTGIEEGGSETVEVVHEALIRGWGRLQNWMDEDRAFRTWQENLRAALRGWEASERDEGGLLRGVSLATAENWLKERCDDLSDLERQFIQSSLHKRIERLKTETIRQERERSLERRSRIFLQALVVILLVAMSISLGFASFARNETRQAIEASSLSLAANARQALSDKDSPTALALALAANRIDEPPLDSQRTLLEAAFSPGPRKLYTVSEIFEDVEGPPLSVAISPDGRTALTGLFDGDIVLWDIATGEEIRRFSGHAPGKFNPARIATYSGVNDIAFSRDGSMAISGGADGFVILWDVATGVETGRFEGHSGAVRAVAISQDGRTAVSGGLSGASMEMPGELILWDVSTSQEIHHFVGNEEAVIDLAFSPDGSKLIASSGEVDYLRTTGQVYSLIIWEVETGKIVHHFEGIDRDIPGIAVNPACTHDPEADDGSCIGQVLAGSTDHNLYLWNLSTGEQIRIFEGHADFVRAVAFSPDGRRAISGSGDGELILWSVEKGELLARFSVHTASVSDIAFNLDGRTALSVASDGTIILLDLFNAAQINRFEGHDASVLDVAFMPSGKHFVSASGPPDPAALLIEEDSIRIWNLESGSQTGSLDWHLSDVFQIAISSDGRWAFSGSMLDHSVRLWDLATGQEIRRFEGHIMPVLSVAFTPDGTRGLSGAGDSRIILWDLETGEAVRQLTGHEGGIWALAVSPDGHTALSGADDRLLIWWDLETGEEIHRFEGHTETVSGVAFSPDGRRAISGDTQGPLIEWDLEERLEIQRFIGHGGVGRVGRTRVAYSPDGRSALSSGWDGSLVLWDLTTGAEIYRFIGHNTDFIFDLAVSPDGSTALSCGTDQNIIQWQLDIPSQEELLDWIDGNRYIRELSCEERELYHIEPLCTANSGK